MKAIRPADKSGFTLMEIIVAVAILSLFIGIIYSTFFGTIRSIRSAETSTDSFQTARVILSNIARDLKGAVHVMNDPRYVFNGIDADGGDPNLDRIDFVTIANMITDEEKPQSDIAEISYYLDPNYSREGYLVRRVDIYPDSEPDKGGEVKIVAEGITGLNFKYFYVEPKTDESALSDVEKEQEKKSAWELLEDPSNWHDKWDWKERNFIPILVKIELSIKEKTGDENTFSTVVYLNRDPATLSAATQITQPTENETGGGGEDEGSRKRGGRDRTGEPGERGERGEKGDRGEKGKGRDNFDRPPISSPIIEQGKTKERPNNFPKNK